MDLLEILSAVSVLNRDDGKVFTVTDRLDTISALLWNSKYRRINSDGLFHLYAALPLEQLSGQPAVVVSSHVDCETGITQCFSQEVGDELLKGTYDNAITNASVLSLMRSGDLPENVLIAFTGDEEEDTEGAKQLTAFLRKHRIRVKHLFVLDVTDMGWEEKADFTVENNFWQDDSGERIVAAADQLAFGWRFVPSDVNAIPAYVNPKNVIRCEAEEDESWYYDEAHLNCCSICLPISGEMHSNRGVLARKDSFINYTSALRRFLQLCSTGDA